MSLSHKHFILFSIIFMLLLSSCSFYNSPARTYTATATLSNLPTPTPTQQPTNTNLPTKSETNCPPFEIEHEIPKSNTPESFIGRHYNNSELPEELEYHEGAVLFGPGDYSFSVMTSKGTLHMLWFEKLVCLNEKGKSFHEILDVTVLPIFADNEMLAFWYCSIDEIADQEVIAFGEAQCGDSHLSNIKQAWRLNRQTEKIEPIPTGNITCQLDIGECSH